MAPTLPPELAQPCPCPCSCKTPYDTPMHETMSPEAENIWLVPPTSVSLMFCSIPSCHSSTLFKFWDDVANYDSAESRYFHTFRHRRDISTVLKYLKVQPIYFLNAYRPVDYPKTTNVKNLTKRTTLTDQKIYQKDKYRIDVVYLV